MSGLNTVGGRLLVTARYVETVRGVMSNLIGGSGQVAAYWTRGTTRWPVTTAHADRNGSPLQNEGASKKILVTTSGYGAALPVGAVLRSRRQAELVDLLISHNL